MNTLLAIIRWSITLPVWGVECLLKTLVSIMMSLAILLMAVFYPLCKSKFKNIKHTWLFKYAYVYRHNFPLTNKVYKLWNI